MLQYCGQICILYIICHTPDKFGYPSSLSWPMPCPGHLGMISRIQPIIPVMSQVVVVHPAWRNCRWCCMLILLMLILLTHHENHYEHHSYIHHILMTGWWYTYPSEKYESVGVVKFSNRMEQYNSCSKPPTSNVNRREIHPIPFQFQHRTSLRCYVNRDAARWQRSSRGFWQSQNGRSNGTLADVCPKSTEIKNQHGLTWLFSCFHVFP